MMIPNSNADNKTVTKRDFPKYLKICLLIVASSFLAYSFYWAVRTPFSIYDMMVFVSLPIFQNSPMSQPFSFLLIMFQEFAAAIGFLTNPIAAILAFQSTIYYIKSDKKWQKTLGKALVFEAVFFILLIPTSIHHIVGALLSMAGADIFAGLSYLLQVLLIVPPFIVLGRNLKNRQNQSSIKKWVSIAASLFVFGFWFKYLFFWIYALYPMGPQPATLMSTIGATNSLLTLLIASILTTIACLGFFKTRKVNKWLVGIALILFGCYFIIYDLVSIWVPIYASFLHVTEVWMITLSILGAAILKMNIKT